MDIQDNECSYDDSLEGPLKEDIGNEQLQK